MKKIAHLFLTAFLALGFTACDSNDEPETPVINVTDGFYILNQGNMSGNIAASITAYNYNTDESTAALEDAFFKVNGMALGDELQDAICCYGKMFLAMYRSNIIWVVEPSTLKVIASIRFTDGDAMNPRSFAFSNGRLYCTMFSGYVCEIDPHSYTIEKTIKVGPNPEGIGVVGNTLIVANSDGMNWTGNYADCSLSLIDLSTGNQTELKDHDKICNPAKVVSNGTDVFVLCNGIYGQIMPKVIKVAGSALEDIQDVCPGSYMALAGNNLYVINSPYGGDLSDITYKVYDAKTFEDKGDFIKQEEGTDSRIEYPAGLGVDPIDGNIVVLSYYLASNGYAQYSEPAYANLYDKTGNFRRRIESGVGPYSVTFVHK